MSQNQADYYTRPPDDRGWELEIQEDEAKFTNSDFKPMCRHRFDYFPARQIWLIFRCVHCGTQFEPSEICAMLNKGAGLLRGDEVPFQAVLDQRIGEVFG